MIYFMSMNRKQRRLQKKNQAKSSPKITRKIKDNVLRAAEQKAIGMALKNAGKEAASIAPLSESLRLNPTQADIHFALAIMARTQPELGVDIEKINDALSNKDALLKSYTTILLILKQKRKYDEAKICQEEYCRLLPDDPLALMDLGLIQNMTNGGGEEAVLDMARALNMAPENAMLKSLFTTSIHRPNFSKFYPEVKDAIQECFKNIYDVNLFRFTRVWLSLIARDPLYKEFIELSPAITDKELKLWLDDLDKDSAAFLNDPYFIDGLRVVMISFYKMENLLTKVRRYICLSIDELIDNGRIELFEQFIYALAEQCFFNEYVYIQDEEETKTIEKLLKNIADKPNKETVGIIACYAPLYRVMSDEKDALHKLAKEDKNFAHMVKTQFDDPAEEERLKTDIPVFGDFANEISKNVRSQYEENPYPRWITFPTHSMPNDDMPILEKERSKAFNILIAGSGTGRQPLATAVRHPNATVTAIDLSRASIAYGIRKAAECGLKDRIKFVHADILSMEDWPDEFDMIECSGVLHHMEDPFEGWKALNSKLKPGGYFKIGLYSKAARQQIVEARDFIGKNNYPSTAEGIRACRKAVFDLPQNHPMRNYLSSSGDFYATSLVRDLIFHVQEHRMTLPQIKDMMDRLGLTCTKFTIASPNVALGYDKMFPDDLNRCNMENWTEFEAKNPLTFTGMYQFWCQKAV